MLTQEQLAERRKHIGGSDVAAILGVSPWRSAYDVWLEKTGQDPGDPKESGPADAGNRFEAAVLDKAEEALGPLKRTVYIVKDGLGFPLAVNLDAQVAKDGTPVEAKTAGLFGPLSAEWGEEGTDEIPEAYILQCQAEMLAADAPVCHVPAFLGGRGFITDPCYEVQRDKALIELMIERLGEFWNGNVVKGTPPAESLPTLDAVKRIHRIPETSVQIDPDLMARWLTAKATVKSAEFEEEQAKAAILAALGTAEGGMGGAAGNITYYQQSRTGFDKDRFQAEHPDLFPAYQTKTFYRVLRHQKPRPKK